MKTRLTLAAFTSVALLWPRPSTLAATRTWSGGGTNSNWTTPANWVGGVAPLAGDDLIFPAGPTQRLPNNDFPSGTTFNTIIISGPPFGQPYLLSGNPFALNAGVIATNGSGGRINNTIVLNSNQTFTINVGANNFNLPGAIDTNGKDLTLDVALASGAQVQASIIGAGGLIKTNTGSLFLYSTNSTFDGPVSVLQGLVSVYSSAALGSTNGVTSVAAQASLALLNELVLGEPFALAGPVVVAGLGAKTLHGPIELIGTNCTLEVSSGTPTTLNGLVSGAGGFTKAGLGVLTLNANNTYTGTSTVNAGTLRVNGAQPQSSVVLNSGTLDGTGTAGSVTAGSAFPATVAPGTSGPGILTCGNVALSASTTFLVELNGTNPGTGHDQLNVQGTVALGNAVLSVSSGMSFGGGESFLIINNDGADAISGTFVGLPEGASVNAGTNELKISYVGGDGNDVVLTSVFSGPPRLSIQPILPASVRLSWATNNAAGFSLQSNTNLSTTNWTAASPAPVVVGSNHVVTNAASGQQRFYRLFKP